jgi:hypothetical protein
LNQEVKPPGGVLNGWGFWKSCSSNAVNHMFGYPESRLTHSPSPGGTGCLGSFRFCAAVLVAFRFVLVAFRSVLVPYAIIDN